MYHGKKQNKMGDNLKDECMLWSPKRWREKYSLVNMPSTYTKIKWEHVFFNVGQFSFFLRTTNKYFTRIVPVLGILFIYIVIGLMGSDFPQIITSQSFK
jgi:hypothetical protein